MALYKITLRPLDSFFFGGSRTYNNDKRGKTSYKDAKGKDKADKQNYFVQSEQFPQQSAVLGMLRYQVLAQNGYLDYDKKGLTASDTNITNLIGEEGFSPNNQAIEYGKIKAISPIFLTNGKENVIPQALDFAYNSEKREAIQQILPTFENEKQQVYNSQKKAWVTTADTGTSYNYKYGKPDLLVNANGNTQYKVEYDEDYEGKVIKNGLFYPFIKIGIDKLKPENAFYKQKRYQLAKNWSFAFFAEMNEVPEKGITYMGAERSAFAFEAHEITAEHTAKSKFEATFQAAFSHLDGKNALVLTSDAFVNYEDIAKHSLFHISQIRDYRALTNNYNSLNRSAQYVLMGRGSVIYAEDIATLSALFNKPHFQNIGYNHFITK